MIKLLIGLFLSLSAYAQFELRVTNSDQIYGPGSIVEAAIVAASDVNISQISPSTLKNSIDKKILLIFSTSPWEKNSEGWIFKTKLVLGPEFKPSHRIELSNLPNQFIYTPDIKWDGAIGNIPQTYIYNDQELFSLNWFMKNKYITIVLGLVLFAILGFYGNLIFKRVQKKKTKKKLLTNMVTDVERADSLEKMSEIWKQRDSYKEQFLNKNKSLDDFFSDLNHIQFKPMVESEELNKVLMKKEVLLRDLREELSGV